MLRALVHGIRIGDMAYLMDRLQPSPGKSSERDVVRQLHGSMHPSDFEPTLNTVWPSTAYNYYYQGHGVVIGRSQSNEAFRAEQDKFVDALRGDRALPVRPAGETNWFVIDSKCRQRLWGTWTGGYYGGADPVLDALLDPFAYHFNEWCSRMQQDAFRNPGDV